MSEPNNEESTDVCNTYIHQQSKPVRKFPVEFHLGQWILPDRKRDTKAERKRKERLAKSVHQMQADWEAIGKDEVIVYC